MSFLDAYSGYHQIKMAVKDQEKTAFIILFGAAGFGDVEPLVLPSLHGLHEGTLGPGDVGELAYHGAATVRELPVDHFRLHLEDLMP